MAPETEEAGGVTSGQPPRDGDNYQAFIDMIRRYAGDYAELQGKQKAIADEIAALGKKAKADGLFVDDLKAILRMSTWTPEEIRAVFERRRAYAQALGMPTNSQGDLFEDALTDDRIPDGARVELSWEIKGHMDGLMGRGWPEDPPKECPEGGCRQAYGRGWERGQKERLEAYAAAKSAEIGTTH